MLRAELKHPVLFAAAKRLGGQVALANYLKISQTTLSSLCNMRFRPKRDFPFWQKLEKPLFELTGKTMVELFPESNTDFLTFARPLRSVKIADSLPLPHARLVEKENAEIIRKVLETLEAREKEILKFRFGLDGTIKTFAELGEMFNVTQTRAKQIFDKALRKMQCDHRSKFLLPMLK